MSKPRAISELLANEFTGELDKAVRRGDSLQRLWHRLQPMLDKDLASHCMLLNLRDDMVIMACDSTVWGTRLRYQIPTLLNALRQTPGLANLREIQISIRPNSETPLPPKVRVAISTHAADCLKQCAESVSDPGLRRALERLAGHARTK